MPRYLGLGHAPGNPPRTPFGHREQTRVTVEPLLGGWERGVVEGEVSERCRVVAEVGLEPSGAAKSVKTC